MNKKRITGLLLIVVGIVMILPSFSFGSSVATPENILYNYIVAVLSFAGIVLILIGITLLLIRKT